MHALHVTQDGLAAKGHGAIHPHCQFGIAAAFHVAAKAGGDLDRQAQFPRAHAPLQLPGGGQGRALDKIARAGEGGDVVPALGRLVPVQHGEGQVFHIQGDAVAENQHQQRGAEEGEGHADRVAQQFPRLAPGVGQQPLRAEGLVALRLPALVLAQKLAAVLALRLPVHRLEGGHEGAFQAVAAGLCDQGGWRVAGQHGTGVHQRDAVAAFAFVHEVGGDEDGHPVLPGQVHQQIPEAVARPRVHTGGGLIQDQQLRFVHHRHRQGQALAHPQGQGAGGVVEHVFQAKLPGQAGDALGDLCRRQVKQAGVQLEVLAHAQFAVEGEGLRHVADASAGGQVLRVQWLAEQRHRALGGGEQAGEHLHGGGLAAAVGAQEAEDLALGDGEADVPHGGEVAEFQGQVLRHDGRAAVAVVAAGGWRRSLSGLRVGSRLLAFVGQQGDKGIVEIVGAGLPVQLGGGAGGEHLAVVHRHQPVVVFRLFHVGGGHQHTHAGALAADGRDQIPEALAGERVDAGGGLVQDQQVRVVDQGAAQAQLLLHAPGELAGGAVAEFQQAGGLQQAINLLPTGRAAKAEEVGEEGEVLVHRQAVVEVAAEALGHVGNARGGAGTHAVAGHVAAEHLQLAGLQLAGAGNQPQQGGLAHPVRADQAHHAARGDRQRDVPQRGGFPVVVADALEPGHGLSHWAASPSGCPARAGSRQCAQRPRPARRS